MKVLLSGGGGMVGKALTAWLVRHDCPVVRLVRRPVVDELTEIFWNPLKKEVDSSKLVGFDIVIHLAGYSVAAGLWSLKTKKKILDSRVAGTELLATEILKMANPPKLFMTASGVHVYGRNGADDEAFDEESPEKGDDFLSEVIRKWEKAAVPVKESGVRTCHLRLGAVLSPTGGMLKKMLPAFKFAAGGRMGNGKQQLSWIDLQDCIRSIWHCIETEDISGAVNVVAPEVVSNKQFTKALAQAVGMPAFLPVPEFILSGFLGDMADCLMLASIKCSPSKLQSSGFEFEYGTLREALNHQLQSNVPEVVVAKKSTSEENDGALKEAESK